MEPILEVKELKKYFPVGGRMLHAVDNVSFSINRGETLGIVGESGCGKSTLGRTLLHLHESTAGTLYFKGENITHINKRKLSTLRKEMQFIFQDPFSSLNPRFTVFQTLAEPLEIAGSYSKKETEEKVYAMMDTVGMAKRLVNTYPHELDGGRRQRIGIGRAMILEPEFIVCDEPVSALDVSIQAQIINLLLDMQEEKKLTYVFITHDLMVVKYISTKIMVMYLGEVVEFAPTEELFSATWHPYTKALLSAVPLPEVDARPQRIVLEGEVTSPIDPPECCRFCARCPYARERCRKEAPPLAEAAPGHMVKCHFVKEINFNKENTKEV